MATQPTKRGKPKRSRSGTYLQGQLLIAMPGMQDPRFARSVVYMCTSKSIQ